MIKYLIAIIVVYIMGYILFLYFNMKNIKRKVLVYPIKQNNELKLKKDIIYKTIDNKNLLMDVYSPGEQNNQTKLPVVIFVHGEGPEIFIKDAKDWGVYTSYGKLLAGEGYIAVTFNHRYAGGNFHKIKDISMDVIDVVKYIEKNSDQWNIDMDKIFIWSFSLGGIYSSIFLNNHYHVKAIISYYGLLDLNSKLPVKMQNEFEEFTPEKYLRNVGNTKILIVKAAMDKVKGVNHSIDSFTKAADKYHVKYEYIIHHTGGHSFDVFVDNEETKDIIYRTLGFIKDNCHE